LEVLIVSQADRRTKSSSREQTIRILGKDETPVQLSVLITENSG
jgi:hypothetical protein